MKKLAEEFNFKQMKEQLKILQRGKRYGEIKEFEKIIANKIVPLKNEV